MSTIAYTINAAGSASVTGMETVSVENFEQFYLREFKPLTAIAASVAGDSRIAEDLAQEALLKVHRRWDRASNYASPGAYARRIVINLALNRRRRLGREARALRRLDADQSPATFAGEGHDELWAAVAELAPKQRAAIALRYLEDRSAAEIAEMLDCTESTARAHLFKARKSLAVALGELVPSEESALNDSAPNDSALNDSALNASKEDQ